MRQIALVTTALCLSSNVLSSAAFGPALPFVNQASCSSATSIFAGVDDSDTEDQKSNEYSDNDSEGRINNSNPDAQTQVLATKNASPADMKTSARPLLGEVAVDGSWVVLAPSVAIGVAGLICSVVIAFNSGDEFVQTTTQFDNGIASQVAIQSKDVCRGICTKDQDGLKNFMQSLRK